MKFPILVIRHKSLFYDVTNQIEQFKAWVAKHAPLSTEVSVEYMDVDIPLKFKDFGVLINTGDFAGEFSETSWGLDGIKEQLRQAVSIPPKTYKMVVFIYDEPKNFPHALANWTYPQPLIDQPFIECAPTVWSVTSNDLVRVLTHEFCHAANRILAFLKVYVLDDMDRYDKEFEIDALDGNRLRNLARLAIYWDIILNPVGASIKTGIQSAIDRLKEMLKSFTVSKINQWALAIQSREGFFAPGVNSAYPNGTRSWHNNNPGNFRSNPFVTTYLGATGKDADGFAYFPSYAAGFSALMKFLTMCAKNQIVGYHDVTLIGFFQKYAPAADNNDPNSYAIEVAQKLGVDPQTPIKNLL